MPQALTIITEIEHKSGDETECLGELLKSLGQNLENNCLIRFDRMQTVHYAAWLILPLRDRPARLLLETNYDGDLGHHLDDLIEHGRDALDQIYSFCVGYPRGSSNAASHADQAAIRKYFLDKRVPCCAYYAGIPDRSLQDIRNAISVYEEARRFLDNKPTDGLNEAQVQSRLITYFRSSSARTRPQLFAVTRRTLLRRRIFNLLWETPLALVYFVAIGIPLMLIAPLYEKAETGLPLPGDETNHCPTYESMVMVEQSHFCTVTTVRNTRFRRFVLKQVLQILNIAAKRFYVLGKLGGVPTIHFGRWLRIDEDQHLIFLSNFDGSWSSYLGDFANPPLGVNLIWGSTQGYPPTRFLVCEGARDLEAFEEQNARHFVPAPVFYSAYRKHSVQNILHYLDFRDALAEAL